MAATKHLLSIADLSAAEIFDILEVTRKLKARRGPSQDLHGKALGMIFQKPSTRTAVSFAVAMYELGGLPLNLNAQDLQIKRGETLADTAKTLSRYVSGIMIRANKHSDVEDVARNATVPVINGLTDKEHPCQVLGDLFTVIEALKLKRPQDLKAVRVVYVGDGNNVAQSWMLAAALLGVPLVVCCPEGYDPEKEFRDKAAELSNGAAAVTYERDPRTAVAGASVVYTDVWASMGKDEERDRRKQVFQPYQVSGDLMRHAAKNAVAMHCLPAHRGEEIADEVMDGPQSVVFDQAENRLHVQKAVLLHYLK
jgi:ornithine carbamoyltransferase